MTEQTGAAYDDINVMAARFVPEDFLGNRGDEISNLSRRGSLSRVCQIFF